MYRKGLGVLVTLFPKIGEGVYEVGLSWFLKGSYFDPVRSFVAVARCAQVHWTGISSLNMRFPYCYETEEVFDLQESHTTVWRKRPLDGDFPVACSSLPARAARFAIEQLLSMD